jgi:biopolymer transport protein TolR
MGMNGGSGGLGGLGGNSRRKEPMSEINVTPFVDVMLVLLVIFIITAPAMKESINVTIPKAKGVQSGQGSQATLSIVLDSTGKAHIGDITLEPSQIALDLPKLLEGKEKQSVTLRAHHQLPYDAVIKVLAILQSKNITNISFAVNSKN